MKMDPFIKDKNKPMGGTEDAYRDMPKRFRKEWAERKRKSRRTRRRLDKQLLEKDYDEL